ncbi:MAG: hypothetical protein ACD_30C00071G0002, partial [uncultured bacterium]
MVKKQLLNTQTLVSLAVIAFLSVFFRFFIQQSIFNNFHLGSTLFLNQLIGVDLRIAESVFLLLGLANLTLMFFLGWKFLGHKGGLLMALLYAISPWVAYFEVVESTYIWLFFWVLVLALGVIFLREKNSFLGRSLTFISGVVLVLSNFFMLFLVPLFLLIVYFSGFINSKRSGYFIFLTGSAILLSFFVLVIKQDIFLGAYRSQVGVLSDIGLLNSVNAFQGETRGVGLAFLAKLVENKYAYFSEQLAVTFLWNFSPAVYFSPTVKLLDFSFTFPILFGFLIPFVLGLSALKKVYQDCPLLLLVIPLLIVPSWSFKGSPDLQRLLLVFPV